jgi:hypothetical protein
MNRGSAANFHNESGESERAIATSGMVALRNDEPEQPPEGVNQTANKERDRQPNEQNGERHSPE